MFSGWYNFFWREKTFAGEEKFQGVPPMYDTLYTVYNFGKLQGIIIILMYDYKFLGSVHIGQFWQIDDEKID